MEKKKYIDQIIGMGYKLIFASNIANAFVNDELESCIILLNSYDTHKDKGLFEPGGFMDVMDELSGYHYAKRSTTCVACEVIGDIEEYLSDVSHCMRITADFLDEIPYKVNKDVTISFKKMSGPREHVNDIDFVLDPYESFDGYICARYDAWLSKVKEDATVFYPASMADAFMYCRYRAYKFYSIRNIE